MISFTAIALEKVCFSKGLISQTLTTWCPENLLPSWSHCAFGKLSPLAFLFTQPLSNEPNVGGFVLHFLAFITQHELFPLSFWLCMECQLGGKGEVGKGCLKGNPKELQIHNQTQETTQIFRGPLLWIRHGQVKLCGGGKIWRIDRICLNEEGKGKKRRKTWRKNPTECW